MRRVSRIFFISFGIIGIILLAGHLYLTYRAKDIFKTLVLDLSDNKYTAEVSEVSYSYLPAGIKIKKLVLKPLNVTEKNTEISCDFINLKIESVWHLLFAKSLEVQKLHLYRPSIIAYAKMKTTDEKRSIATTIREIQQALFKTFDELEVQDALIADASIKIIKNDSKDGYFSLNHITIDLKDIDILKKANIKHLNITGSGTISLVKPDIHFADSTVKASLGFLQANSHTHNLKIDALNFNHLNSEGKVDTVSFSRISLTKLNWVRFLEEGIFEIDSIQIAKGLARLSIPEKIKEEASPKKKKQAAYTGTPFIVHYASVSDVSYSLQSNYYIGKQKDPLLLRVNGDSMVLKEFSLLNGRSPAAHVDALKVHVTNFAESDANNSYSFSLGDIAIDNNTLILKNNLLKAAEGSKFSTGNKVEIPEIRLENYSLEDALQKKLVADKITVSKPEVVIDILEKTATQKEEKKDVNRSIEKMITSLRAKLAIDKIAIEDASIRMLPKAAATEEIKLSGLSIMVDGKKAMQSSSVMDIIHSISAFSTSGFTLTSTNTNLQLKDVKLLTSPRGLYFGNIKGNFGPDAFIDLNGVTLLNSNNTLNITSLEGLHASDILVESGSITITKQRRSEMTNKKQNPPPVIRSDRMKLDNIVLKMEEEGKLAVSSTFDLNAEDFMFANNHANWSKLSIGGHENKVIAGTTNFDAGSMSISQPGYLEILQASGNYSKKNVSVHFKAEKLQVGIGVVSTDVDELTVKSIHMFRPALDVTLTTKKTTEPEVLNPKKGFANNIGLESFTLEDASIAFTAKNISGEETHTVKMQSSHLQCNNLQVIGDEIAPQISIGSASYFTNAVQTRIAEKLFNPASLYVKLSGIFLQAQAMKATVDTLLLKDIKHTIFGKKNDTLSMHVAELGVANIPYNKVDSIVWKKLLLNNAWWVKGGNIQYHTPQQLISLNGLQLNHTSLLSLAFDTLAMRPRLSRESFWQSQPFEKDYMTISMGKTFSKDLKVNLDSTNPAVSIGKLFVNNLQLTPERDKTRPEDTVTYRPLLAAQIMGIPLKMKIDSLLLNNGKVLYHEIVQKTGKEATLLLDQVKGSITNIKTYDIKENDSLIIVMNTRLYGKGPLRLNFRQSYTDTLQGFWMRTRMGKFNMPEMNALLLPQMGLRIHSGIIDTLTMLVNGNKYFAYGTMDLRYHNMSVQLMGKGDEGKFFMAGTVNWIVNQILRRHDNGRPNLVFKTRVQKRGQFNYWGKIAVEGLLTNIGIKTDKKERKNFKKNIHLYQLPPDYWQEDD